MCCSNISSSIWRHTYLHFPLLYVTACNSLMFRNTYFIMVTWYATNYTNNKEEKQNGRTFNFLVTFHSLQKKNKKEWQGGTGNYRQRKKQLLKIDILLYKWLQSIIKFWQIYQGCKDIETRFFLDPFFNWTYFPYLLFGIYYIYTLADIGQVVVA